ncbi:MAG: hypothetical protein GY810_02710 [Aureispira sp.]|nr:hypothetical protein [Aureispira sp.]
MKALQSIVTSLNADEANSAGTQLFMLLLEGGITLADPKPQDAALLIPPSKEPQFKIKALCKIPEIKKSKQIGICQIIAVGEKEEGLHLFDLYKRGGKLKITPKLLTRLNKMGKKKGLKFRKPVTEENTEENPNTEGGTDNALLGPIIARLEQAQNNFEAAPNLGVLKIWSNVMMKLKQEIQLLAKKSPDQLEAAKNIFNEWNQKLAAAKKQLAGDKASPKTEDIHAKLDALNIKKDQVAENPTIDTVIGLLAECQKLRTSPVSKSAFKKDGEALRRCLGN